MLLVDNLGEADATVMERLNPLLEDPPVWVLAEQGQTQPLDVHPRFRVAATMTPPRHHGSSGVRSQSQELSPALANRLSIVHMPDAMDAPPEAFQAEVQQLCGVLCGDGPGPGSDPRVAAQLCQLLRDELLGAPGVLPFTFRAVARLLECTHHLCAASPGLGFVDGLWWAYLVTLQPQLGALPALEARVTGAVSALLKRQLPQGRSALRGLEEAGPLLGLAAGATSVRQHVLTPSRRKQATAVMACVACSFPVLLEGPAAVGKTSLVTALAEEVGVHVVRVNNSDSTTVQHYLGSYLPAASGALAYHPGPLLLALEQGSWFLADELNLAPPAVMSVLAPLLEGQRSIQLPGTARQVVAAPGFRFFATQNGACFADRHPLPLSLKSRLVEVQVGQGGREEWAQLGLVEAQVGQEGGREGPN